MKKPGFGIAETLIAATMIATLVLAFMGVTSVINHSAQLAYQQAVAADLAQQRIEVMRYSVQANWNNSRAATLTALNRTEWAQGVTSDATAQTITIGSITYNVKATVSQNLTSTLPLYATDGSGTTQQAPASSADVLYRLVHVDVIWSDGGASRSYALETVLTNWREGIL